MVVAGDAVNETVAMVGPDRQMCIGEAGVPGGRAEEEDILLGGANEIADGLRETVCLTTGRRRKHIHRL